MSQILRVVLEFFVKWWGFVGCFSPPNVLPNVLPKLSWITVTCPKSVKINEEDKLWFLQSQQNDYQFWTAQN